MSRIWGAITAELAIKIGGMIFAAAIFLWGASASVATIKAEIVANRELIETKLKILETRMDGFERRIDDRLEWLEQRR